MVDAGVVIHMLPAVDRIQAIEFCVCAFRFKSDMQIQSRPGAACLQVVGTILAIGRLAAPASGLRGRPEALQLADARG